MSRIAFNGNALGTGTFTIASPNSNSDRTVTLPDQTGTLVLSGNSASFTSASVSGATRTGSLVVNGDNISATNSLGFRNRILNGDCRIDQRNAGAEINPAVDDTYYLDRWKVTSGAAGKFKIGQNAGSVTPPAGFSKYLGCTSLSAYSVGATESFLITQVIEGFNFADMDWGTANAKSVTLSFYVYSSLTGTFGGSLRNSAVNRSYPFSYTISSANTWELKTVTIAGDTSGTWIGATNGIGVLVGFSLGSGSSRVSTAGAWAASNYTGVTGQTSVVGTNGATFYITGVQLEAGTNASAFERRDYGRELMMCQRYAIQLVNTNPEWIATGFANSGTNAFATIQLPVVMRSSSQTLTVSSASHFTALNGAANTVTATALTLDRASARSPNIGITVASGLTLGQGSALYSNNGSASLVISAEL